jgi:hypothetical protein
MNDHLLALLRWLQLRDAILHALEQHPSEAGLASVEAGGSGEPETILAVCADGTEIALEVSTLQGGKAANE